MEPNSVGVRHCDNCGGVAKEDPRWVLIVFVEAMIILLIGVIFGYTFAWIK